MPRYALRIEYDGGPFHGWQRQALGQALGQNGDQNGDEAGGLSAGGARPGAALASVQGAIEAALARLDPGAPAVLGAGRTDTGVHATGQIAHADLSRPWDPFRLAQALNAHLRPAPVAVTAAIPVADTFHARFSATGRAYLYRILCRRAPPVLDRGRVWHVAHPLDPEAMRQAAAMLVGRHDFTTFRAALCQAKSPVKTLDSIAIETRPVPGGRELHLAFAARSFLHAQVRSMVGTLERVGAGAWPPDRVATALAARDRAACGPVAPPQGLCLTRVRYDPDPFAEP
jgi:tRNA pseudouridine38-40 synthase